VTVPRRLLLLVLLSLGTAAAGGCEQKAHQRKTGVQPAPRRAHPPRPPPKKKHATHEHTHGAHPHEPHAHHHHPHPHPHLDGPDGHHHPY
jgi:hypothetical protein